VVQPARYVKANATAATAAEMRMCFIDFQLRFIEISMFKFRQRTYHISHRTRLCMCDPMLAVLLLLVSVVVCQAQATDEAGKLAYC